MAVDAAVDAGNLLGSVLRSANEQLGATGRRVAKFIDENRQIVLASSAAALGARIGTSDATVLRTVQTLGFASLADLKSAILKSGSVSTPADDMRRKISPRFDGENIERNLKVVDRIKEIADQKKITPSQLALAWVLAQGKDMVPIPGTKRRTYLEENVAAATVQLSKSELAQIEEVAPKGFAAGGRYHDMSTVNV